MEAQSDTSVLLMVCRFRYHPPCLVANMAAEFSSHNSSGAADSSASAASAAVGSPLSSSPPAAVFPLSPPRHCLESVLSLCSLAELAVFLRVSRLWLSAVASAPRIRSSAVNPRLPLDAVLLSPLARHLSRWSTEDHLSASYLSFLFAHLPSVESLHGRMWLRPTADEPTIRFSERLRELSVMLITPLTASDVNGVMEAACALPLLESLTLSLSHLTPKTDLLILSKAPSLRVAAVGAANRS